MVDALSNALSGLNRASQKINVAANNIANVSGTSNVDIAKESVDILEAKTVFKANLGVIKVQDDLNKQLLDIIA